MPGALETLRLRRSVSVIEDTEEPTYFAVIRIIGGSCCYGQVLCNLAALVSSGQIIPVQWFIEKPDIPTRLC